jgi:hypothetical protein
MKSSIRGFPYQWRWNTSAGERGCSAVWDAKFRRRPFFLVLFFFVHFSNSPFIQKSSKPTIK